jgi:glycine oxidase
VTSETDVLVVGAGIIGCAIAADLAARGCGVTVVEARAIGKGATQASAGVLAPYIEAHEGGTLLELTIRSLDLYDQWMSDVRAESGVDVEYRRSGSLEVALDPESAARLARMPAHFGPGARLSWLDAAEARAAEPALSQSTLGALRAPTHGYVAAPVLAEALGRAAVSRGAVFHQGVRAAGIDAGADQVEVRADAGRSWRAQHVVIAAGSWTSQLEGLGGAATDVRPVRGQLLRVSWSGAPLAGVIWGPGCYLVPWADGTLLIGATMEDVGFDERNTAAGVRTLLEAAWALLPKVEDATFVEARVGLRPATSDGLPIIGPSESNDRIVYATGHYRNGILLAPLTARLVADLVIDRRRDPVLDLLAPGRHGTVASSST